MKILEFECTALSDLVLSETVGTLQQSTLGFIPGSALRGIAAAQYADFGELADVVFHSGQVSFGNAYPVVAGEAARPMPASFFAHATQKSNVRNFAAGDRDMGYKRVKDEFLAGGLRFTPGRRQAIKTAINREYGTAKEGQLFLYEALPAGMQFSFEVRLEDAAGAAADKIRQALVGVRRVGRSKGAEFGKIEIRPKGERSHNGFAEGTDKRLIVLLIADLCLPDSTFSVPTISPKLFGLDGNWKLDEQNCFVSWGQISFYNSKKNTRSSARQLVKRGSVISFVTSDGNAKAWQIPNLVGAHTEEGFGAIEVNPKFMEGQKLQLQVPADQKAVAVEAMRLSRPGETAQLMAALKKIVPPARAQADETGKVAEAARHVHEYVAQVAQPPSAAQWGNIRQMATHKTSKSEFFKDLDDAFKKGHMQRTFAQEVGIRSLADIISAALSRLDNYPADIIQFCKLVQGGSRE